MYVLYVSLGRASYLDILYQAVTTNQVNRHPLVGAFGLQAGCVPANNP